MSTLQNTTKLTWAIADVSRIISVQEAERSVVNGNSNDAHVVSV